MDHDLLIILRPGPYICASWDHGGFPYWLLKRYPNITLRSSDPDFLMEVGKWFGKLFKRIAKYTYANGGPIIMIQIENEYGFWPAVCDKRYLEFLRDTVRKYVGNETILFTIDNPVESYVNCSKIDGVYPTIDFGVGTDEQVRSHFEAQRKNLPHGGPLVNAEFYTGCSKN